jgi:hypothetical protein
LRGFRLSRTVRPRVVNPRITRLTPPNLATESEVVVDDPNPGAALRRASGGRHACGASTDHEDFKVLLCCPGHPFQFS